MVRNGVATILLAGILTGCSSSGGDRAEEESAREHMSIASALESQSHWNDAALVYAKVAELYRDSENYATAVRKAAILFSRPDNPSANDSTVMHWFRQYAGLRLPQEERTLVESHLRTLEELKSTKELLSAQKTITDSIANVQQQQEIDVLAREDRVKAMETQLQRELAKTRQELEKLREIDMKVGREKDEGK